MKAIGYGNAVRYVAGRGFAFGVLSIESAKCLELDPISKIKSDLAVIAAKE
jgi:hypothetical protein